ncbi:MAG: uncharacterized protein JWQ45_603 [Blastococcus sp.]|jgi:hypothetical protein|nr:uncharacterized protein [Blastococcus sp.]
MSDRTPGSVRSGSPTGDAAAPKDSAESYPAPAAPVSATQSIPGTGTQRAQAPAVPGGPGAVPGRPATGSPATGATAAPATTGGSAAASAARPADRPADRSAARTTRGPAKSGRGPRRARLQLRHIDTWSALKISLVLSIALFFIWMVAVGILYMVLNTLGVFHTLNDLFGQVGSVSGSEATGDVITPGVVFGGAAVIGAINIVLMTALCTVATFIYNLCSDLVGGLEITLSERD